MVRVVLATQDLLSVPAPGAAVTCSRERRRGRDLLLYRSGVGAGSGVTCGLQFVPSLQQGESGYSKKIVESPAISGSPIRCFRIDRSQNGSRHLSIDQPIDRLGLPPRSAGLRPPPAAAIAGPEMSVRTQLGGHHDRNVLVG